MAVPRAQRIRASGRSRPAPIASAAGHTRHVMQPASPYDPARDPALTNAVCLKGCASARPVGRLLRRVLLLVAALLCGPALAASFEGYPLAQHRLSNGLSVWHLHRPGPSVAAFLMVNVGSRHEDPAQAGIAHVLEHFVFAETARWSESEVQREAHRLGATKNGLTSQDRTTYYIATSSESLDPAMAWLAQVVVHPTLAKAHFDRTREVVLRELGGEPGLWFHASRSVGLGGLIQKDVLAPVLPGSGLDQLPIGREKSLKSLTHEQVLAFHQAHYHPGNAVLVVVGDAGDAGLPALAERHFGEWTRIDRPPTSATPPGPMTGPVRVVQRGLHPSDLGTYWTGGRTEGVASADAVPLLVLSAYLRDQLHERLRVQESLVYSVAVTPRLFDDAGVLWVATESRRDLLDRIEEVTEATIADLVAGRIDGEALERAKVSLAGTRALRLETTANLGFELLSRLGPATGEAPVDFGERMKAVGPDDLQSLAARVFAPANCFTAIHKPMTDADTLVVFGVLVLGVVIGRWWFAWRRSVSASAELLELEALEAESLAAGQVQEGKSAQLVAGEELLLAVRQFKAGQVGKIHGPPGSLLLRCTSNAPQGDLSLDDLRVGALYIGMPEGDGLVRVVDDSGEDYLYPMACFVVVARA